MQVDPNKSFGFLIHDIARLMCKAFDKKAQTLGLTRSQWTVLIHLRRQDGLKQADLANLLEVQPISLTRLIDRLVNKGWVVRKKDPSDRRAKRIFLTAKVKPLTGKLLELGKKTREEALKGLDKASIEKLMGMLLDIRANVTAINIQK
jgi:MarR family transcriptional regulator for hemolysin